MSPCRRLAAAALLPSLAAAVAMLFTGTPAAPAEPEKPAVKLAVLVVFDQLRGDYLSRWDELFGDGGFHRLEKDGAWFKNCHYPYANTVTGAGHASLATGCSPNKHGIILNDWYDREAGEEVYCAASPRYQQVPPAPPRKPKEGDKEPQRRDRGAGSPERLLMPTLGDALKAATGGKGKVVALSLKDRSSVLPGGRRPDACYWFDPAGGNFVTSTYYREKVHPWVEELNRGRLAASWFGKDWQKLRPDLDYEKYSGPDDGKGEGKGYGQGVTFPHPTDGGLREPGKEYYEALYNSPFGNELLLALAKKAIAAEELGKHDVPDLLTLSFSCNDPVGHVWGPDSQEVLDVTLRTDRLLKDLLDYLDTTVGKGKYALVLSADHGICPLPEASRGRGVEAARLSPETLRKEAGAYLRRKFNEKDEKAVVIEAVADNDIYLNRRWLKADALEPGKVEGALAAWLKERAGVRTAYTRTQLLGEIAADDAVGRRVHKSFYPTRSGDVVLVTKPYYLLTSRPTGTNHGTPHPYDTHVPLLAFGPGVRGGVRNDAVTPQAAAAILARALGIKAPAGAEAPVPEKLFAE